MKLTARLAALWRNLVHGDEGARDLDEEVHAYARLLEDEKVAQGLSRADARRAALVEIGGVESVKEAVRDVRAGALLETVWQDLRYGARTLARTPAFTAAAVVALALGIGATTAIFSVVDAVLVRTLPYDHPERLAVVLHRGTKPVAPANFLDWKRESASFARMGAAEYWQPNLTASDRPERVLGLHVTADVLPLLGVPPLVGRLFAADEDRPGREHEVVLGYRLWQRRFGGEASIV